MKKYLPHMKEDDLPSTEFNHLIIGHGVKNCPEMLIESASQILTGAQWDRFYAAARLAPVLKMKKKFDKILPYYDRHERNEDGIGSYEQSSGNVMIHFNRCGVKGIAIPVPSKNNMDEDKLIMFATDGEKCLVQKTSYNKLRSLSYTNSETIYTRFLDKPSKQDMVRANLKDFSYQQFVSDKEIGDFTTLLFHSEVYCDMHQ